MHVMTTPTFADTDGNDTALVILDIKVMDLTALVLMTVPIAISDLSLKPTVMPTLHVPTLTVPTNVLVMTGITATVLTAKTQMNVPFLVQLGNSMVLPINFMVLICVTSMPLAVIPMAIIHVLVMKVSKATVLPAKILMNALIQLDDKLLKMIVT